MPVAPESLANLRPDLRTPWTTDDGNNPAPKGRKNAGLSADEHCNALSMLMDDGRLFADDIRSIAKSDPNLNRRAGAIQLLRRCENPDIADYAAVIDGEKSIDQLRDDGVDTTQVKKLKKRRRVIRRKDQTETVIEHEIELRDRAGDSYDRIANRTEGLPVQRQITQSTSVELKVERKIITDDDVRKALAMLPAPDAGSDDADPSE